MPLASADPFGGLIITDWYQPAGLTDERLKVHVLILDRSLRADGVKVSVFRQLRDARGDWVDEPVDPKTVSRARGQDPDQGARAADRRARDHRLSHAPRGAPAAVVLAWRRSRGGRSFSQIEV